MKRHPCVRAPLMDRSPERSLPRQDLSSTLQVAQVYRRATDSILPDILDMILLGQVLLRLSERDLIARVSSPPRKPELQVVRFRPLPCEAAPYSRHYPVALDFLYRNLWEPFLAHTPGLASFVRSGC